MYESQDSTDKLLDWVKEFRKVAEYVKATYIPCSNKCLEGTICDSTWFSKKCAFSEEKNLNAQLYYIREQEFLIL